MKRAIARDPISFQRSTGQHPGAPGLAIVGGLGVWPKTRDLEQSPDLIFDSAQGDVGVLSERRAGSEIELMQIFKGIMSYLAIVILSMVLMYFPGIALWPRDKLRALCTIEIPGRWKV